MTADLGSRHRNTFERFFNHPTSGNIEWREVLEAVSFNDASNCGRRQLLLWQRLASGGAFPGESVFAQPLIILKPRMVEVFKKLKVRSLVFDPVSIGTDI